MYDQQPSLESTLPALQRDGYNVCVVNGLLIARDIPYVTASGAIETGILSFPVDDTPEGLMATIDHTAYFLGEPPCGPFKTPLDLIANHNASFNIPGVGIAKLHLSRKKTFGATTVSSYSNAREKLETYISTISASATRLDPAATAKTGRIASDVAMPGPFLYPDSASARVGLGHLNEVFEGQSIGIIGLGGTGAYILDLVAKTSVPVIHLFDGGKFRAHTAFRAPGAATKNEVDAAEFKVARYQRQYSAFRNGIEAHCFNVETNNTDLLKGLNFVFIAVDTVTARQMIEKTLRSLRIPYVDVGLGAEVLEKPKLSLVSTVRTTSWTPEDENEPECSTSEDAYIEDDYSSNIQIAELNALNATLAVIRWKRHLGYYQDLVAERESQFNTNNHSLVNL